jgi:uncharacterized membrane protein YedE/YeeE
VIAFTPVAAAAATAGGALIGLAACLLLLLNGRIAGISGILGAVPRAVGADRTWRVLFLLGLAVGGAIVMNAWPGSIDPSTDRPLYALGIAGLLVGFGTRLGSGCTSGHGVCGLARLSGRSLVATCVFMLAAVITAAIVRVTLRGPS